MKSSSFRFLWIGQAFANLGDVFYILGLISIMYTVSQSAFYLALLPFINTLGRFISGYLSPILFKKYPLKTLLSGSQSSKTVGLLTLATLITINHTIPLWLSYSSFSSLHFWMVGSPQQVEQCFRD